MEMLTYLTIAFIIGALVGYLVRPAIAGDDGQAHSHPPPKRDDAQIASLKAEIARYKQKIVALETTQDVPEGDADDAASTAPADADPPGKAETAPPAAPPPPGPEESDPAPADDAGEEEVDAAPSFLMDSPPDSPDSLKKLKGLGAAMEKKLNGWGVYTYAQMAQMGDSELAWLDSKDLRMGRRARKDDWVGQARELIG